MVGVPTKISCGTKTGFADGLVERDLSRRSSDRIRELFDGSKLSRAGVIDDESFIGAFEKYCKAVDSRGDNTAAVGSQSIWRTISAEIWLRALA